MTEREAAIGQLAEAIAEIFIDRPGVDDLIRQDVAADAFEIYAKLQRDIVVIEHVLEHGGESTQRHRLELIREITVVGVRSCWDTRRDTLVQFGRIKSPLLACV